VVLISLSLFALAFLVFFPVARNEFINYDDTVYVTENPHVQTGPTWANLQWALTSGHAGNWHPLTWLSHMIDCRLYGPKPFGHHLTSVVIHALNTMLLFLALQRMTGAIGRSLAVAVFFGVHPLRVESVAWVAERKDVLSGLFFMLMLLAYAQYVQQSTVHRLKSAFFYSLTLAAFALGLMSKPMLVTTPFILVLLDRWPLNRASSSLFQIPAVPQRELFNNIGSSTRVQLLLEKIPFFLLAAASSVVTFVAQERGKAVVTVLPFIARVENASVSYSRYIGKLLWPVNLAVHYPYVNSWPLAIILGCAVALAAISFFAVSLSQRHPYLFTGWFWYLGMLVPVIGLVQVGTQSMADRYTYLPVIGILLMIVWGMHELTGGKRNWEVALSTVGIIAAVECTALTSRQIGRWKDSETLFQHALAVTSENAVALDNYGRALGEKGRLDEAMKQYYAALRLNTNDAFACNGLGVLLMKKYDYEAASEHLRKALTLDPQNAIAHYNLGIIAARTGSLDDAIGHFEEAIRLQPDFADAHNNLGGALATRRRFGDAIPHYRAAIRLKPRSALIHKNLGVALTETDRIDEAIPEFREAVRLQPDFTEARERLRVAIELNPNTGSTVNSPRNP
jgi:Tfp pilus assembly protein PilF